MTWESLSFRFPSASRRALGSIALPDTSTLWTPSVEGGQHLIWNCTFHGADGTPLLLHAGKAGAVVVRNSLFEYNDWTGFSAGGNGPGLPAMAGTVLASSKRLTFDHNTMRFNGDSEALDPGEGALISNNWFETQYEVQMDGSMVEGGGFPSQTIIDNWVIGTGKSSLRFDGIPGGSNGSMLRNVVMDAGAMIIKGDSHLIENNTIFYQTDINIFQPVKTFRVPWKVGDSLDAIDSTLPPLLDVMHDAWKGENKHTIVRGNLADSYTNVGVASNNIIGAAAMIDIRTQLRDPINRDFRSCKGSTAAVNGVGAYPIAASTAAVYAIPGRQEWRASAPSPPDGSISARVDTDLLFRPALHAASHAIFLAGVEMNGSVPMPSTWQRFDLEGWSANVLRLPAQDSLLSNRSYVWRVDATLVDGTLAPGPTWRVATLSGPGSKVCTAPPSPSPSPPSPSPPSPSPPTPTPPSPSPPSPSPPPPSPRCAAELGKYHCKQGYGTKCENCVKKNSDALRNARCWPKRGENAFTKEWCDGT
jgi:hypothetical protein